MSKRRLSVAIPASVVSDIPHLREKTCKIGCIGRTAAIFRVDEIVIYPDNPHVQQEADQNLIAMLLAYMETPQYLRKALFKIEPELKYAGILPPLRTPHHPLNRKMKNLKIGEYREAVTISKTKEGSLVDVGVERHALVRNAQLPTYRRVTVKISKLEKLEATLANRSEISDYWGYTITIEKTPLSQILKKAAFDLRLATSKYGSPFAEKTSEIVRKWKNAQKVLIAFGSPSKGLSEIVSQEGLSLNNVADFVINTIPMQGTETVRTEEALAATLALLNVAVVSRPDVFS